jgi:hypothetical protein
MYPIRHIRARSLDIGFGFIKHYVLVHSADFEESRVQIR